MKGKTKILLSAFLSVMMIVGMIPFSPITAQAASIQHQDNTYVMKADGTVTRNGEVTTIGSADDPTLILGGWDATTTTGSVTVEGGTHDLILWGVSYDYSSNTGVAPIEIKSGTVHIELRGTNTIKSNNDIPCIHVASGANLIITGGDEDVLNATSAGDGAGIGGCGHFLLDGETCGNITIDSGIINASSSFGAGIGGGSETNASNITINGGTINTTSMGGYGIGGGIYGSTTGSIKINGGTITANSTLGISSGIQKLDLSGYSFPSVAYGSDESSAVNTNDVSDTSLFTSAKYVKIMEHTHSYSYSVDSSDSTKHIGTCSICGAKTESQEHTYGEWDSSTGKRVCTVCGAEESCNHSYNYAVDSNDSSKHIGTCSICGAKTESQEHNYVYDSGSKSLVCSVCGATKDLTSVDYIDRYFDSSSNSVVSTPKTISDFTVLTADTSELTTGWYVVASNLTINDTITVNGDAKLIILNGFTLNANDGISVPEHNSLTLYGQNGDKGVLNASTSKSYCAAIGGQGSGMYSGSVIINGATINARAAYYASVLGGAKNRAAQVIINGGNITLTADYTDVMCLGGNTKINGGNIKLNAGSKYTRCCEARPQLSNMLVYQSSDNNNFTQVNYADQTDLTFTSKFEGSAAANYLKIVPCGEHSYSLSANDYSAETTTKVLTYSCIYCNDKYTENIDCSEYATELAKAQAILDDADYEVNYAKSYRTAFESSMSTAKDGFKYGTSASDIASATTSVTNAINALNSSKIDASVAGVTFDVEADKIVATYNGNTINYALDDTIPIIGDLITSVRFQSITVNGNGNDKAVNLIFNGNVLQASGYGSDGISPLTVNDAKVNVTYKGNVKFIACTDGSIAPAIRLTENSNLTLTPYDETATLLVKGSNNYYGGGCAISGANNVKSGNVVIDGGTVNIVAGGGIFNGNPNSVSVNTLDIKNSANVTFSTGGSSDNANGLVYADTFTVSSDSTATYFGRVLESGNAKNISNEEVTYRTVDLNNDGKLDQIMHNDTVYNVNYVEAVASKDCVTPATYNHYECTDGNSKLFDLSYNEVSNVDDLSKPMGPHAELTTATSNGNGTHTGTCPRCGETATSDCHYVNGHCPVCNSAAPSIDYVDRTYSDGKVTTTNLSTTDYTEVTSDLTQWTDGWYLVNKDTTINGTVTTNGDVKLIVCDGVTLNINCCIKVESGSFTVYGQQNDTGVLKADQPAPSYYQSGIGGNNVDIVINGAYVYAYGNWNGGCAITGKSITINGGNVNTDGRNAYGLNSNNISINGGTVLSRNRITSVPKFGSDYLIEKSTDGESYSLLYYSDISVDTLASGYFRIVPCTEHIYSYSPDSNDSTKHIAKCVYCGKEVVSEHSYGDWNSETGTRECSICGYVDHCTHSYNYVADPDDNTKHIGTCSICGGTVVDDHSFNYEVDTVDSTKHIGTCSDCGFTVTDNHSYTYKVDPDDSTKHIGTCSVCGNKISTNHNYVYDASSNSLICSDCGATKDITNVDYIDRNYDSASNSVVSTPKTISDYKIVTEDTTELTTGWYVVVSNLTINNSITVNGDAKLIIINGFTLNANNGISVSSGNSFTLYGQDGDEGILNATTSQSYFAAIGGQGYGTYGGSVNINGATLNATTAYYASVLGAVPGSSGQVTINGGNVTLTASASDVTCLGGNAKLNGGNIKLNGGGIYTRCCEGKPTVSNMVVYQSSDNNNFSRVNYADQTDLTFTSKFEGSATANYLKIVPCDEHHYSETVTPGTCTERGYTTHTCDYCGNSYVDSYTDYVHSYELLKHVAPTYTKEGYDEYKCSICGNVNVEVLAPTGNPDLDYDALEAAITTAKAVDRTIYTGSSYSALMQKVAVDVSDATEQNTIDTLTGEILNLIGNLEKVKFDVTYRVMLDGEQVETSTNTYSYGELVKFDALSYTDATAYNWSVSTDSSVAKTDTNLKLFNLIVNSDCTVTLNLSSTPKDVGEKQKITFLDSNGMIIAIQYADYLYGADTSAVTPPEIPFYEFDSWETTDGKTYQATYSYHSTNCMVVGGNNVKINGQNIYFAKYDEEIKITSADGSKLALSTNDNQSGIITYLNREYIHAPKTSTIYVIEVEEVKPSIGITGKYVEDYSPKKSVSVNAKYYLPADAKLIEKGTIGSISKSYNSDETLRIGGKLVVKFAANLQTAANEYTVTVKTNFGTADKYYTRAYLVYSDDEGTHTIYSNITEISLN